MAHCNWLCGEGLEAWLPVVLGIPSGLAFFVWYCRRIEAEQRRRREAEGRG